MKSNVGHKISRTIQWVLILVAHFGLLYWIVYILHQAGFMEMNEVALHFVGVSIYGAALIRLCAWIYHRRFIREQRPQ